MDGVGGAVGDSIDDYLEAMRSEGLTDSSGKFTFDIARAQSKLAHFFQPQSQDFIHYWIRFAVFSGAAKIDVDSTSSEVSLEFKAVGPEVESVESLFGQRDLGMRYLQLGVIGALRQGFQSVYLETPRLVARFELGAQTVEPRTSDGACRLRAEKALTGASWFGSRVRGWLSQSSILRARDLPYLKTPLRVRHRLWAPQGLVDQNRLHLTTDRELAQRLQAAPSQIFLGESDDASISYLHLSIQTSPSDRGPSRPELYLLVHGQHFPAPSGLSVGLPPDTRVIVEPAVIQFDLSLRQVALPGLDEFTMTGLMRLLRLRLAQTLQDTPALYAYVPLSVGEWLTYHLLLQGQRTQAALLGRPFLARRAKDKANPLLAAILERTALLSGELELVQASEEAWQAVRGSGQTFAFNYDLLVDCGAVRTPADGWLVAASKSLIGILAVEFFRETIMLSAIANRLNPRVLALLPHLPPTFAQCFLLTRHLLQQKPAPTWYARAMHCAAQLLRVRAVEADPSIPQGLSEEEQSRIYFLVESLSVQGVEALEQEEERLSASIKASSLSPVRVMQLERDREEARDWMLPYKFQFLYFRALIQRFQQQRPQAHSLVGILKEELESCIAATQERGKDTSAYLQLAHLVAQEFLAQEYPDT